MFADWELIGVPLRITVGERHLQSGNVELQIRCDPSTTEIVPLAQVHELARSRLAQVALR